MLKKTTWSWTTSPPVFASRELCSSNSVTNFFLCLHSIVSLSTSSWTTFYRAWTSESETQWRRTSNQDYAWTFRHPATNYKTVRRDTTLFCQSFTTHLRQWRRFARED